MNAHRLVGASAADSVAGGFFEEAGGKPASRIARWDGAAWHRLDSGTNSTVFALASYDGFLYAGGFLRFAGRHAAERFARWDGSAWHVLEGGLDGPVYAMAVHDGRLIVGGEFESAGGRPARNIVAWNCPRHFCYANCTGATEPGGWPPLLTIDDFLCFMDQFAAAQQLSIPEQISHYANCTRATEPPVLTVDDFLCFMNEFAAGCP